VARKDRRFKEDTVIVHTGSDPRAHHGIVNPPVYHASTIVSPTLAAYHEIGKKRFQKGVYTYGRHGTPTQAALEEAIAALEGGERAAVVGSGVAAIDAAILAFVKSGDHVLMVDSVYGPIRRFCDTFLKRFGVEVTYYDPLIGKGIATLMRDTTRVVYTESPGSLTFEVQDVPSIAAAAHARKAVVIHDNTWSAGVYFKPFAHGVDVSVQSATKYIGGHSDLMMGSIVTTEVLWTRVRNSVADLGAASAPDDAYLALRGLRSIKVRLARHMETGLLLATWLKSRPEVARVIHPALPGDPGHAIWLRDFTGASGLFGFELKPVSTKAVAALVDGLELYGIGASWGGFESLILPAEPIRTATEWSPAGPVLRVHAGLEDPDDLIADLARGFERMATNV
jgi:cystathionine beta-lyase